MKYGDQKKIAHLAKISYSHLNQILRGDKRPSWNTSKRLAAVTATNPLIWLEGTPEQIRSAVEASFR
jgi:transcriptional regulator with XRE-family HTH domain